jgi:hypothetical protein
MSDGLNDRVANDFWKKTIILIIIITTETNCHAMPATINAASLRASGSSAREREIGAWATNGKKPHETTAAAEECAERRHRVLGASFVGSLSRVLSWGLYVESLRGGVSLWDSFLSAHGNYGILCIKVLCKVKRNLLNLSMTRFESNYSSCTGKSSENICSSSGGA